MYNVYDAFAIKDDIKRGVYFHKYFWDDNANVLDERIKEFIELHENGTFVESSEDYVQSLFNMIIITYQSKDRIRNYNLLFHTTLINFYDFGTKEDAWMTLSDFKKDDFQVWIRAKKLLTLSNKIRND